MQATISLAISVVDPEPIPQGSGFGTDLNLTLKN
jgi:hypothetical protein